MKREYIITVESVQTDVTELIPQSRGMLRYKSKNSDDSKEQLFVTLSISDLMNAFRQNARSSRSATGKLQVAR